jgi:hypothetical protein
MIYRKFLRDLGIGVLILFLSACSLPSEAVAETPMPSPSPFPTISVPSPTPNVKLPFEGVWFSEDRSSILIFTDTTFYYRVFGPERETYANIVEYDLAAGHILIRYYAIFSYGQPLGFDSPTWYLTYKIEGNTIQIAIESLNYPTDVVPMKFYYDEALSSP